MNIFDRIADKMFRKQWNIGFAKADIGDIIVHRRLPDFKWLPIQKPHRFFADPFIFKTPEGTLNVIYEDYSSDEQYGKISLAKLDDRFKPLSSKLILDTGSHLSYPNVFRREGKTFVMPEASKGGDLICYEYDFAKDALVNPRTVMANEPLLDSTILEYNGKFWLFATKRGKDSNNLLYIYFSDRFDSGYQPHAGNPVKNSLDGSRPAGNFVHLDGQIYRPSQNCAEYYGKSITFNRIKKLTEHEFEEEAVIAINPPRKGGFSYGIHTINAVDDVIVIDALKRIFMPMEQVKIFFKKIFKS